jgi:hypothetical protein
MTEPNVEAHLPSVPGHSTEAQRMASFLAERALALEFAFPLDEIVSEIDPRRALRVR